MSGFYRRRVPGEHRLALVGEAQCGHGFTRLGQRTRTRLDHRVVELGGIDLDEAAGQMAGPYLGEPGADDTAFGADHQGLGAGRALVDGEHRTAHDVPSRVITDRQPAVAVRVPSSGPHQPRIGSVDWLITSQLTCCEKTFAMIGMVVCGRFRAPIVTAVPRDLLNRRPEEGCCYSTPPSCPVPCPGRAGDGQRRSTPRLRSRGSRPGTARGPPGGPRRALDVDAQPAGADHRLVAVDPAHPGAGRGGRGHRRGADLARRGARQCAGPR